MAEVVDLYEPVYDTPKLNLDLLLSTPLLPPDRFHSTFWFCFSFIVWIVLHIYITPLYAFVGDRLQICYKYYHHLRYGRVEILSSTPSGGLFTEWSWGQRFTLSYHSLSTSKRAYWRRLFRSFIYYVGAIIFGFYFLLTYMRSVIDMYLVYTPGMDIAFCFAASHFLWCCIEDWPCRAHMGHTTNEQTTTTTTAATIQQVAIGKRQ